MPCYLGNEAGSSSFLQRTTKVSVAAFLKCPRPIASAKRFYGRMHAASSTARGRRD
jgi:hypothetical protein